MAVDFFGRKIIPTTSEKKKKRKLKKAIAHFRFKEGFTNAVRRAVSIKDLFLIKMNFAKEHVLC